MASQSSRTPTPPAVLRHLSVASRRVSCFFLHAPASCCSPLLLRLPLILRVSLLFLFLLLLSALPCLSRGRRSARGSRSRHSRAAAPRWMRRRSPHALRLRSSRQLQRPNGGRRFLLQLPCPRARVWCCLFISKITDFPRKIARCPIFPRAKLRHRALRFSPWAHLGRAPRAFGRGIRPDRPMLRCAGRCRTATSAGGRWLTSIGYFVWFSRHQSRVSPRSAPN